MVTCKICSVEKPRSAFSTNQLKRGKKCLDCCKVADIDNIVDGAKKLTIPSIHTITKIGRRHTDNKFVIYTVNGNYYSDDQTVKSWCNDAIALCLLAGGNSIAKLFPSQVEFSKEGQKTKITFLDVESAKTEKPDVSEKFPCIKNGLVIQNKQLVNMDGNIYSVYNALCDSKPTKYIIQGTSWDFSIEVSFIDGELCYKDKNGKQILVYEQDEEEYYEW